MRVNVDLVLAAKQEVEERYNAEKEKRLAAEAEAKAAKQALPTTQEMPK